MHTNYSTRSTFYLVPMVAMLIAFAWSSLMGEPVTNRVAYPLPAQAVAASPAEVQSN